MDLQAIKLLGYIMPDMHKKLSACLTKQEVYKIYRESIERRHGKPLQMSQFGTIPKVITPKVRSESCV